MTIDTSKLLQNAGKTSEYSLESGPEKIRQRDGGEFLSEQVKPLQLLIKSKENSTLLIRYSGATAVLIPCARCLEPVKYVFEYSGERKLVLNRSDMKEDEYSFVCNNKICPKKLIIEEILARWPIRVLCRSDCKGICPVCGANLNISACGCRKPARDTRMADALKDFRPIKEV